MRKQVVVNIIAVKTFKKFIYIATRLFTKLKYLLLNIIFDELYLEIKNFSHKFTPLFPMESKDNYFLKKTVYHKIII